MENTLNRKIEVVRTEYLNETSLLEFVIDSKYPDITTAYVKYIDTTRPGNHTKKDSVGEINLEDATVKEIDGITTITSKDNEHIIEFNNKAVAHYISINNSSIFLLSVYDVTKHEIAPYELKESIYKSLFRKESKAKTNIKKNLN